MGKHFKTRGIVIRKTDLNDADRIVTVLAEDFGKIGCIAKGARRLSSKFCGRLELFYDIEISCFQGRELAYLNEVNLISGLPEIKDINIHRVLFYIAELTNRLIQPGQRIEGSYPLLSETLYRLGYGLPELKFIQTDEKPETILHVYIIKLLTLAGFLPPWNKCAICGDLLDTVNPISLSAIDANTVCHDCASPEDRLLKIPLIKWVNFMQNYPLSDAMKVKADEETLLMVWHWLQRVLGNLLNSPIKSEEFLRAQYTERRT